MAQNKQKKQKNPPRDQSSGNDPYGIADIVIAIQDSQLPEGKKIAFLYMIAEGTFSLKCMDDISLELEVIGEKLEADIWRKKAKVLELERQTAALDQQLDDLAISAAQEHQQNMDTFLQYVSTHTEAQQTESEQEKIAKLHKDLSQE